MNKHCFSQKGQSLLEEKGQSLLEIAVSLGLVALIITILTITTINGLRNSQFAKNQVLASSYSQQGVELIKVMRQKDCQVTTTSGIIYKWFNSSAGNPIIWDNSSDTTFDVNNGNFFIPNVTTCVMTQQALAESLESGQFTRSTKLERISAGVIRVTVIVSWNDFSGPHETKNVSLVTNY